MLMVLGRCSTMKCTNSPTSVETHLKTAASLELMDQN